MFCQNLCIFSGRLGADPEVKEFDWGTVLKFGIAVDMPRMDKTTNTWVNETSWANCEFIESKDNFGKGKGKTIRSLRKGDVVHVHTRFQNKDKFITFRIVDIFPEQKPREDSSYDLGGEPRSQRPAV